MQPVYYLPAAAAAPQTQSDLAALGLGYAFENFVAAPVTRGPATDDEGHPLPGIVVGENRVGSTPRYCPDVQTWHELPGGKAWVGFWDKHPPTPADLARRDPLPGQVIELADGQRWLIPLARRWYEDGEGVPVAQIELPQQLAFNGHRWELGDVVARYRPLWRLVEAYCAAVAIACRDAGDDPRSTVRFQFDDLDRLAVGAVATNYRVADSELSILGAYTETSRAAIVETVLDNATFERLVKKNLSLQPSAQNSGAG